MYKIFKGDKMKLKYDAVIFDFDGTVADTGKGIFNCIRYTLEKHNLPQLSENSLRTFVGPPLHESFMRECGVDNETANSLVAGYRERYAEKGIYEFDLYDGITDVLSLIQQNGGLTGIASSKPEDFINIILNDTGLSKYFDVTSGSDPRYVESDKTTIVKNCIKKMNLNDDAKILMVGDRLYDIIGAHNAGLPCACVLFGYGSENEFLEYNADFIVKDDEELKNVIFS